MVEFQPRISLLLSTTYLAIIRNAGFRDIRIVKSLVISGDLYKAFYTTWGGEHGELG